MRLIKSSPVWDSTIHTCTCLFSQWFYFRKFHESDPAEIFHFSLFLFSNENIRKSQVSVPSPKLQNICMRKLWSIQPVLVDLNDFSLINLLNSATFSLQSPDITKQPQTFLESIQKAN